jgi:hypothetical protein
LKKLALAILISTGSLTVIADEYVGPHVRQDGTFVQGHYRTDANETRIDNYSTRGNVNPYTGQKGYQDPYKSSTYGDGYSTPKSTYGEPYKNPYGQKRSR